MSHRRRQQGDVCLSTERTTNTCRVIRFTITINKSGRPNRDLFQIRVNSVASTRCRNYRKTTETRVVAVTTVKLRTVRGRGN